MEKTTLNHHSANVLAVCDSTGEFLLGQYDLSYPGKNKQWIGRVKLLGGNYFSGEEDDKSPLETLMTRILIFFNTEIIQKSLIHLFDINYYGNSTNFKRRIFSF